MRITLGCDHWGGELKSSIIGLLNERGSTPVDLGTYTTDSVDYPDIAKKVGKSVASGDADMGILICGTGIGMSIAANKIKGIRAALCCDLFSTERARQHNDANILCLGEKTPKSLLPEIVSAFLDTEFEGGRHKRRVDKIMAMEE